MDVSVITVTWNSKAVIGEQVRSVQVGCKTSSFEQIVVDNASSDGTGEYLSSEFPEIKLIQNRKNSGFASANNAAAKNARGEFILFLNPDMVVSPGSLDVIVDWMRNHKEVGIAGCLLVTSNGQPHPDAQPRRFPGLKDQLAVMLKIKKCFRGALDHYLFRDFFLIGNKSSIPFAVLSCSCAVRFIPNSDTRLILVIIFGSKMLIYAAKFGDLVTPSSTRQSYPVSTGWA